MVRLAPRPAKGFHHEVFCFKPKVFGVNERAIHVEEHGAGHHVLDNRTSGRCTMPKEQRPITTLMERASPGLGYGEGVMMTKSTDGRTAAGLLLVAWMEVSND